MKTTKMITFSMLIALALMSTNMFAQRGHGMGMMQRPAFSMFDTNGDGFINKEEFYKVKGERMSERAKNGGQMKNAANSPKFESFDTNGDGKISKAEFQQHQQNHSLQNKNKVKAQNKNKAMNKNRQAMQNKMMGFKNFDKNKDGFINKEEFQLAKEQRERMKAKNGGQMKNAQMAPKFEMLDANGDGKISKEEFMQHRSQHQNRTVK